MQVPKETEKILNRLGYYDAAPQKVEEIQDYINEAAEFLRGSGVPPQKMTSATALAVKSIWRVNGTRETRRSSSKRTE